MVKKDFLIIFILILFSIIPITTFFQRLDFSDDIVFDSTQKTSLFKPKWSASSLLYQDVYHTPEQVIEEIENFESIAPDIINLEVLGESVQGRDIHLVTITNEAKTDPKAGVFIVGQHHAREQITVESILRYILYLINNYNSNDNIKELVDQLEIYIIPTINPDGLHYVVGNDTLDGNEWLRKNLHQFDDDGDGLFDEDSIEDVDGDGIISEFDVLVYDEMTKDYEFSYYYMEGIDNDGDGLINEDIIGGVDLNRNYPYRWNDTSLDSGSTSDTTSDVYPGTAPFSEPETQILRDFVINRSFAASYALHSGINATYFPWGSENYWAENSLYYSIYNDLLDVLPASFDYLGYNNPVTSKIGNYDENNLGSKISGLSYTTAGGWGDWMYTKENKCQVPIIFEIYHNASSNNEYVLHSRNSTHEILKWNGMYGYFAPRESAIDSLCQDVQPAYDYLLEIIPRLEISKISNKELTSTEDARTYDLIIDINNLSPRLSSQEDLNYYNKEIKLGSLLAQTPEINPGVNSISLEYTINKNESKSDFFILIGNDYVGYQKLYPFKSSKASGFEFYYIGILAFFISISASIKRKSY